MKVMIFTLEQELAREIETLKTLEAIRYVNTTNILQAVDNSLEREKLIELLDERALTRYTIDITGIRRDLTHTNLFRPFRHLG